MFQLFISVCFDATVAVVNLYKTFNKCTIGSFQLIIASTGNKNANWSWLIIKIRWNILHESTVSVVILLYFYRQDFLFHIWRWVWLNGYIKTRWQHLTIETFYRRQHGLLLFTTALFSAPACTTCLCFELIKIWRFTWKKPV